MKPDVWRYHMLGFEQALLTLSHDFNWLGNTVAEKLMVEHYMKLSDMLERAAQAEQKFGDLTAWRHGHSIDGLVARIEQLLYRVELVVMLDSPTYRFADEAHDAVFGKWRTHAAALHSLKLEVS